MLIPINVLLQEEPAPAPKPTVQKFELGGGGGPMVPMYDIVDYVHVLDSFREIPDEHPVMRAVRRAKHLNEGLTYARRARQAEERAMAMGVLYGAALERTASQEAQAVLAARAAGELAEARAEVSILEQGMRDLRAQKTVEPVPAGGVIALFLLGMGTAIALSKMSEKRR